MPNEGLPMISPCVWEFKLSDPFPMEKPCSENVRASNSLSNISEPGSTHHFFRKFLACHLYLSFRHLSIFSSGVFPLQFLGFREMNGIAFNFLIRRRLVPYAS